MKISEFWTKVMVEMTKLPINGDKHHELPMARIKRIMKMDESVKSCVVLMVFAYFKMIGSEAPVLIAQACEVFIRELTLVAWMHTEESKRRTLQVSISLSLAFRKAILFPPCATTKCTTF